jgi:hypothetical protein
MKTYRQLQDELHPIEKELNEWLGWNSPDCSAGVPSVQAVDDVDSAAHSVERPEMLEKLNAYCHDIANKQYLNPYMPLNALWKKLMMIGINFDLKKILMTGEQGRVEVPLSQFGGRFGVLGSPDGFVSGDDGIKDRVPGGLNLVVTYQKTGGVYTLDATIEHGAQAVGFGEEIVSESQNDEWARSQTVSMDSPTPDHPVVKKFKSLYAKHAKSGNSQFTSEPDVKQLPGGKSGFAGSGSSKFEYKGHKFDVNRGANGKGFSGTHHSISHVSSPVTEIWSKEELEKHFPKKNAMIKCTQKTFPGCGCGGYHMDEKKPLVKKRITEARATKGDIHQHLTSHGFEYSPLHGDDTYHHPSGHSFYLTKKGDNFWHEHNGVEKGSGGAFPGENVYDSALASAKRLTDQLKKEKKK